MRSRHAVALEQDVAADLAPPLEPLHWQRGGADTMSRIPGRPAARRPGATPLGRGRLQAVSASRRWSHRHEQGELARGDPAQTCSASNFGGISQRAPTHSAQVEDVMIPCTWCSGRTSRSSRPPATPGGDEARHLRTMFACVVTTPLDLPVVPLV